MNEPRDPSAYLKHILDSIEAIEEYLDGVDKTEFSNNSLLRDGVVRQLEIIGEAVKNLPEPIRSDYPDVPWADIAGTRDKLIHGYFSVDVDTVWITAQRDLDPSKKRSNRFLRIVFPE